MPVLRGHCTKPEDLVGVRWPDWVADAEAALDDLLAHDAERAVVVGLSMGGLAALHLCVRHPEKLAGCVTVAAALRLANPLAPFARFLAPFMPWVEKRVGPGDYADPERAKTSTNYTRFPAEAAVTLYEFTRHTERILPQVRTPLLIIHSRRDGTVKPISAQIIYDRVASVEKKIIWFEKSGHEMMRDLEREAVFETIVDFLRERRRVVSSAYHTSSI
jgi:carboxylesterase